MKSNIKIQYMIGLSLIGILLCTACSSNEPIQQVSKKETTNISSSTRIPISTPCSKVLSGQWKTTLKDGTDLTIILNENKKEIYLTSIQEACQFYPLQGVSWEKDHIRFVVPRGIGSLNFDVKLKEDKLSGIYKFYDEKEEISFEKSADTYVTGEARTAEFDDPYLELQEKIKTYSEYQEDGLEYEFTYEPKKKELCKEIIEQYGLDQIVQGKDDVERMEAILNWECDLLDHSSMNIAESQDIKSLIEDGIRNGVNCRGLSIILTEILRMYGIKAQTIACLPEQNVFFDCHVVVQAYSEELRQWILLDPTYGMLLKDEDGNYINLQTLRDCIVNDVKLNWNSKAGYNGATMSEEELKVYLAYMAKNSFVYVKEIKNDGIVVLVSKNYKSAKEYTTPKYTVYTTDAEKFWIE